MRTIQSPGVEIKEVDLSLRPVFPTGTNIMVAGYSDKGPTDEVIQVTSQSEFEQIYGVPSTPAERYFYHTVRPLFQSPANILTYRLPYGSESGNGFGNDYGVLAYPVSAINIGNTITEGDDIPYGGGLRTLNQSPSGVMYTLGRPKHFSLTQKQYNQILQKDGFDFSNIGTKAEELSSFETLGKAGLLVLNKGQTTIDEKFQGFYIGAVDNTNLNPATDFDGILNTKTIGQSAEVTTNYLSLPSTRLDFTLSSISDNNTSTFGQEDDSVSEIMENLSKFDIATNDFDDTVSLGLFKLRQSPFSPDTIKLNYVLSESYVGSFDSFRQINTSDGGAPVSFYLDTKENDSPNVQILTNKYVSHAEDGGTWLDINGKPSNKVRFTSTKFATDTSSIKNIETLSASYGATTLAQAAALSASLFQTTNQLGAADSLFPLGSYASQDSKTKDLGSIPAKLDRLFDTVENIDLFDIDLTLDGGISTINAVSEFLERTGQGKYFDDTAPISAFDGFYTSDIVNNLTTEAKAFRSDWKTIFDRFAEFAEKRRKDHMFVADLPKPIFIQGKSFLTLDDPNKNFSLNVLKPIQAHTSIVNTSYAATYAQWAQVYDSYLDDQCYVPFSGFAGAAMANTDANFQPWFAPAGFTRGVVTGVNDLALYPKQKQRDQLYKISTNPVAFFPGEGFVIFGQKTLLKKPSAFDRINVRRLFLNLEKATRQTVKYFVFEPNTLLTRTRVLNTLTPIFDNAKNTEGVYDFLVVCDERNNTPTVIDQNELIVDIYLKPVRAAEFILVNFYATKTGADFNELVG
tara:strand:+ start:18709 stop:21108 length:2400 start_codon:yes stop_codon:yes gene_type:complete